MDIIDYYLKVWTLPIIKNLNIIRIAYDIMIMLNLSIS